MRTAALAGGIVVVLMLVGCRDGGVKPSGVKGDRAKVWQRDEFKEAFLGESLDVVRKTLGAPDDAKGVGDPYDGSWRYDKRTANGDTVDIHVSVWHKNNRVVQIDWPPVLRR